MSQRVPSATRTHQRSSGGHATQIGTVAGDVHVTHLQVTHHYHYYHCSRKGGGMRHSTLVPEAPYTPDNLMRQAFWMGRSPTRSLAFREGCQALFKLVLEQRNVVELYVEGTAEYDAFYSGMEEGRAILKGRTA
jgi:hypothetical protein